MALAFILLMMFLGNVPKVFKLFICAFLLALLSLVIVPGLQAQTMAAQQVAPFQLRGMWVDAFGPGFKTPTEVDKLILDASQMGLNALFVQASRRMDCYCNRSVVPRSADPNLAPNFDPLEDVIAKAHAAGIQVHAWIIATAVWNTIEPYGATDHVWRTHGPGTSGINNWMNFRFDGITQSGPDFFLDPGHPDAVNYISQMVSSLVQNYNLDGIQLDRIRYPDSGLNSFDPAWGYNPTSLARFRFETGRSDTPTPKDALWTEWRRDQITNLVRRIYFETKISKPNMWVSAATIVYKEGPANREDFKNKRTYFELLQDWPSWLEQNILDMAIMMNYRRDRTTDERNQFDQWNTFASNLLNNQPRAKIAVGTALYLNPMQDSLAQIHRAISVPNLAGWVGYSHRNPDLDTYQNKRASASSLWLFKNKLHEANIFPNPSLWEKPNAQKLGAVFGQIKQAGRILAGQRMELNNDQADERKIIFSDANGFFGQTGLNSSNYHLRVGNNEVKVKINEGQIVDLGAIDLP